MATRGSFESYECSDIFNIMESISEDYLATLEREDDDDLSGDFHHADLEVVTETNEDSDVEVLAVPESVDTVGSTSQCSSSAITTDTRGREFSCECKCSLNFEKEFIEQQITLNQSLTKEQLDLVILGRISAVLNDSKVTGERHKHKNTERKRSRCSFRIHDFHVCKDFFLHLCSIKEDRFKALVTHYKVSGPTPRDFFYKGRNSLAVNYEESKAIFAFLQNIAEIHALALPGRVPGFSKEEVKVLPSHLTIASIHQLYKESCELAGKKARSKITFRRIWLDLAPWLLISKPSTDLCWECHQNNNYIMRSSNMANQEKLLRLNNHVVHLKRAEVARQYFNDCIRNTNPDGLHLSFDYAQQVHYPSDPNQPGPIYFKTPRKCGIFGVCCETTREQTNFLIDEAFTTKKGANSVVSFLHHYMESVPHIKSLILHADNCCGQNKNNILMAYLAWRVNNRKNEYIEMNFLVAGHTKFSCDSMFGVMKKRYRRTMVSSLDDIARVVEESCPGNKSQLVGTACGDVLVPLFNWKKYFSRCKRIPHILNQHQFKFHSEQQGLVRFREFYNEGDEASIVISTPMLPNMPEEIMPEGLSRERQLYLFREIREFCRPGTEDVVCPKPI